MSLPAGARLGPYEILAPAGAGAMGEVYRARDLRLGREVAIKVLPASFAADPERLRRFEQEARAASALNHPNILVVHDLGTHDGAPYLVSELLSGKSLRARLAAGALPLRQAVELAAQMARGLAAAHERGIVHRDLKPENVFLTSDGRLKILDFGLAKLEPAPSPAPPAAGAADAETLTRGAAGTEAGLVLGTAGYMAPEQVRGQPADARSDIFSFGCVLYEMLSGWRAFQRETAADSLAAILREEPPPLPGERGVPPALERLLWHCLEKKPEERFQSARDLAFDLESWSSASGVGTAPAALPGAPRTPRAWLAAPGSPVWLAWLGRLAWPVLALGLLAASFALGRGFRPPAPARDAPPRPLRATFRQLTDLPGVAESPRLSPDGNSIVFVSRAAGNADIYLQRVGGHNPINLTKDCPQDDEEPAFSPDGERIAFRSECGGGGIFVMGATGESRRRIADFGHDPTFSPDGRRIAVATGTTRSPLLRNALSQLWVVDVASGAKRLLSSADSMQPSWSPGGQRIAYWGVRLPSSQRDLWTVPAEGGAAVEVTNDPAADWDPVWSPDGRFLYFSSDRGGTMNLWRIGIDEGSGRVVGAPEAMTTPAPWSGQIGISSDGRRLVYATRDERSTLYRVGLDPVRAALVSAPRFIFSGSRPAFHLDVSPDGRSIVFGTYGGQENLFAVGLDGSGYRQLTDDPGRNRWPVWTPDGARIAFQSERRGHLEIWAIRPDGSGLERLVASRQDLMGPRFSPDGRFLSVSNLRQSFVVPLGRAVEDPPARQLPATPEGLQFIPMSWSPDGSRLAGYGFRPDGFGTGIFLYSLASGAFQKLRALEPTAVFAAVRWVGPGRQVAYVEQGGLFLVDTQSLRSRELLPRHTLGATAVAYGFTPDGRTLVYSEATTKGDVWLMNLE